MAKKGFTLLLVFLLTSAFCGVSYPQTPPPGETGGGIQRQNQQIQTERELEKQIKTKKKKPEAPVIEEKAAPPAAEGEKVLITRIEVRGVTLISREAITKITADYVGKSLSVKDMQKVCDLITDEYRTRGRVTSRAYLPPQNIKDGLLVIVVLEGRIGNVEVRNNKFFSAAQVKKN